LFFVSAQETTTADDLGASTPKISAPLDNPKLSVRIPGLNFDKAVCTEKECSNNWIATYIVAIYKYGISTIGILAVIIIMIGGIIWLTAGGNQQRVADAKKWIGGSLMGVLIAFTSYVILNMVNPALTELSPIKLAYIANIDLEPITIAPDEVDGTTGLEDSVTTTNGTSTSGTSETQCGCPWDIQFNYAHISYLNNGKKSGNMYKHGCGAVSSWDLARCKGKNYSLEQWIQLLDKYDVAAGTDGSVGGNMPSVFQAIGLNTEYFGDLKSAGKKMDELQSKNPMMVIGVRGIYKGGTENCQFTKRGHFIFAPKKTGESLCINDPSNSGGYDNRKNTTINQIQRDCLVSGVTVVW
jgi:hypothetical protein